MFWTACNIKLVSGPDGVPDSHITATSVRQTEYYLYAPWRLRMNTEEEVTSGGIWAGGWSANTSDTKQFVMVFPST